MGVVLRVVLRVVLGVVLGVTGSKDRVVELEVWSMVNLDLKTHRVTILKGNKFIFGFFVLRFFEIREVR